MAGRGGGVAVERGAGDELAGGRIIGGHPADIDAAAGGDRHDLGCAVAVPVVVAIDAGNAVEFDFETVDFAAGVVNDIEIGQRAVQRDLRGGGNRGEGEGRHGQKRCSRCGG
jgi:hypothetical protein